MLSKNDLRELYDALGGKQDRAAYYEEPALEKLLDLLSEEDIHAALGEARHLLEPGGLLCLTGLSYSPNRWPA